ncbi:transporter substrate-binding domain-containing protein [Halomonas sp. NPDC076908]|uniref:transporter substrate-binding domain-containing protein n=1 Tax=Halomonas sp. NPDC076908 TaxID=3390567 RepID=UPI003CFED97A
MKNKSFLIMGTAITLLTTGGKAVSSDTLSVSTETQFPPMGFIEGGELKGLNIDLGEALANRMGIQIDWRRSQFNQFLSDITTGRSDAVIAGMVDMPERQENHTFVDFFETGYQFFTTADVADSEGIVEIEDFCGLTVAASRNSSYAAAINKWSEDNCEQDHIRVLDTDGSSNALLQLRQGRAQGVMQTTETISYLAANDKGITAIGEPITSDYYGMIVAKNNPELADRLANALTEMMEDGSYKEILAAWDLEKQAIDEVTINLESR